MRARLSVDRQLLRYMRQIRKMRAATRSQEQRKAYSYALRYLAQQLRQSGGAA